MAPQSPVPARAANFSSGTSSGTVLLGGDEFVLAGGTATGAWSAAPALKSFQRGGYRSGTILDQSGFLDDFGVAINTTVNAHCTVFVEAGGIASGGVVRAAGELEVQSLA